MDDATPPPESEPEPEPEPPDLADRGPTLGPGAVAFLTLGVASALCVLLAGGIGYLIDGWAHTSPLFTLVGLGLGLVAAVLMAVARIREYL